MFPLIFNRNLRSNKLNYYFIKKKKFCAFLEHSTIHPKLLELAFREKMNMSWWFISFCIFTFRKLQEQYTNFTHCDTLVSKES